MQLLFHRIYEMADMMIDKQLGESTVRTQINC
jgi:hypothetical protein